MPRRPNNKIRLRCNTCKKFNQLINLILIKKKLVIDLTLKLCVQFVLNLKQNI